MEEFAARWREAIELRELYVAGLPGWVRAWMAWMGMVLPSCLLFVVWKAEARWTLAAVAASLLGANLIGTLFGWSRLWSLAHVVFWTPLVVYLVRRWGALEFRPHLGGRRLELTPVFRAWAAVTVATMSISLAFDYLDVVRFALTGR